MKRILFVDDEPKILSGLRRMLRAWRHQWEMAFAASGIEALDLCDSSPFDIVVSDARMPSMDGSEFLGEVQKRYPDTVRFVLSGQCSRGSTVKCIGVAHQFLSKPCDPETLKSAVERVCTMRDQFHDMEVRKMIARVESLPSQGAVYRELSERVESLTPSMEEVAEIMAGDVAMCAKTMQLVSSGFFGRPQRVTNATQAAELLGLEIIRELVASSTAFMPCEARDHCGRSIAALSEHSLAVAAAARQVAKTFSSDQTVADDAYLAGALHEIGTLALRHDHFGFSSPSGSVPPDRAASAEDGGRFDGELCDPDPGGYLAALWGLPGPIIQAIPHHRRPGCSAEPAAGPLAAVHVANALLEQPTSSLDDSFTGLDRDYLRRIGCASHFEDWREICAPYRPEGVTP